MKSDRLARRRAARRFEMKPPCLAVFSGLRGLLVLFVGVAVLSCGSSPSSSPSSPSSLPTAVYVQPSDRTALLGTLSGIGQTVQLSATAAFSVGGHQENQDVTSIAAWQSSNVAVATVSGGLVTAVAAGTVTIAATYQGKTGTANISVAPGSVMTAAVDGAAFNGVAITVKRSSAAPFGDALQICVDAADALTDPHFVLRFCAQPNVGTFDLRSLAESTWVDLFDKTTGLTWASDATGGGGTLTISTMTPTSASGTFSATLAPGTGTPSGAGVKVITNGVFNVGS
jgi:hypothetical protein